MQSLSPSFFYYNPYFETVPFDPEQQEKIKQKAKRLSDKIWNMLEHIGGGVSFEDIVYFEFMATALNQYGADIDRLNVPLSSSYAHLIFSVGEIFIYAIRFAHSPLPESSIGPCLSRRIETIRTRWKKTTEEQAILKKEHKETRDAYSSSCAATALDFIKQGEETIAFIRQHIFPTIRVNPFVHSEAFLPHERTGGQQEAKDLADQLATLLLVVGEDQEMFPFMQLLSALKSYAAQEDLVSSSIRERTNEMVSPLQVFHQALDPDSLFYEKIASIMKKGLTAPQWQSFYEQLRPIMGNIVSLLYEKFPSQRAPVKERVLPLDLPLEMRTRLQKAALNLSLEINSKTQNPFSLNREKSSPAKYLDIPFLFSANKLLYECFDAVSQALFLYGETGEFHHIVGHPANMQVGEILVAAIGAPSTFNIQRKIPNHRYHLFLYVEELRSLVSNITEPSMLDAFNDYIKAGEQAICFIKTHLLEMISLEFLDPLSHLLKFSISKIGQTATQRHAQRLANQLRPVLVTCALKLQKCHKYYKEPVLNLLQALELYAHYGDLPLPFIPQYSLSLVIPIFQEFIRCWDKEVTIMNLTHPSFNTYLHSPTHHWVKDYEQLHTVLNDVIAFLKTDAIPLHI